MCGFVGIIGKGEAAFPQETLARMNSLITHRGPDDEGFYRAEPWLALGFRRLSILDLSPKGHQPMLSRDGRHVIVFNGEIYNYRELREELCAKGRSFISDSDTEVVLAAWQEWGRACLDRFVGMFAFLVADLEKKTAFAARDPLGIKPLFLFEDGQFLIFCSEIKALLPYTKLAPNLAAFNEYLVFRSLPGRETMFSNVVSIAPGACVEIKDGAAREEVYFNLADTLCEDNSLSFEDACAETERLLAESVKLHLRSDVELGVQLSGGVDSSLITALASRELHRRFHSFSISFAESDFDESRYQKMSSERYGTEHHDYQIGEDDFLDLFEESIWHYEHPLNDPNAVCTHYLVKKAREHVTVMLSGEGADESFLGYTRFLPATVRKMAWRNWFYQHPKIREALYKSWPLRKGRAFLNITRYSPTMYALSYAKLELVDKLLKGEERGCEWRRKVLSEGLGNTLREEILADQSCDLAQWFSRADRIGMASSMELRVPFCTAPMFKLANSIPYKLRVHGGERKAVLKKVAEKYLDHEQIYRKKIGFGTPIPRWLEKSGNYSGMLDDVLDSSRFRSREFIDQKHASLIYSSHKKGSYVENNSGFLWTYPNLELWHRIFFEGGWRRFVK
ncbi:MAG: asparagine synthase (glutamine-hydrolyzing) [Lentisphaerae bacterium GWF2_52_8]|nr:MAG: asparagine synthase (glutamine-hydrolyzing) [Lentisphaerae bacterium GWF2_52_8]